MRCRVSRQVNFKCAISSAEIASISPFAGRTPNETYAIDNGAREIGGVIEPRFHLSQAAILFHATGPFLSYPVTLGAKH
jgi:hypothetical protein